MRNGVSSPRLGGAQGEGVNKVPLSFPQAFPDLYLVTLQEWRPQPALGLPGLRTCSQCKATFPVEIIVAVLFLHSFPISWVSLSLDLFLEVYLFLSINTFFSQSRLMVHWGRGEW